MHSIQDRVLIPSWDKIQASATIPVDDDLILVCVNNRAFFSGCQWFGIWVNMPVKPDPLANDVVIDRHVGY